jgi:hypothetical protein
LSPSLVREQSRRWTTPLTTS